MIVVEVYCNGLGDRAEADSPEAALVAARVLYDEAYGHAAGTFTPRVAVYVDGRLAAVVEGRP